MHAAHACSWPACMGALRHEAVTSMRMHTMIVTYKTMHASPRRCVPTPSYAWQRTWMCAIRETCMPAHSDACQPLERACQPAGGACQALEPACRLEQMHANPWSMHAGLSRCVPSPGACMPA
eukprot:364550-Chlamydomonas_euryale.AAC.6